MVVSRLGFEPRTRGSAAPVHGVAWQTLRSTDAPHASTSSTASAGVPFAVGVTGGDVPRCPTVHLRTGFTPKSWRRSQIVAPFSLSAVSARDVGVAGRATHKDAGAEGQGAGGGVCSLSTPPRVTTCPLLSRYMTMKKLPSASDANATTSAPAGTPKSRRRLS